MKIVLLIWGILVFFFGLMEFVTATTVMQQIVAGLALVAGTVAFSAFGTIGAIETQKVTGKI